MKTKQQKAHPAHKKYPLRKHARNVALQLLGSLIVVVGFTIFVTPNKLLAGGVWGISAILNHYIPQLPIAVFLVILNAPLLIWGWSKLHLRFALYTVYVILLQSGLLMLAPQLLPTYTSNPLLACMFGGVLIGLGSGLVVRYHGSGGGIDIVAIILKQKYDVSVGTISMSVNACVVFAAAFVFGFEPAMYTMVQMFVCSQVFSQVLEGLNRKRNMMIVSAKGEEIAQRLIHELGRGVTMMKGEGGYTHQPKDVLFCVVSRFELAGLKEIVREVDPHAFVCINQTYEVMGAFPKKAAKNDEALLKAAEDEED